MIYDMNLELRNFTYITNLYKCISNYNLMGHQIGRKIGDMLEIITMGAIYQNPALLSCLDTEGKLEGYTSAGHKVEFGFFEDPLNKDGLFGAIECKCVGVEETKFGKRNKITLSKNNYEEFAFSGHWMQNPFSVKVSLVDINNGIANFLISTTDGSYQTNRMLMTNDVIRLGIDENESFFVTTPHGNMLDEVPGLIRKLITIKVDKIDEETCSIGLFSCLTGPQTIEKAKQASLVAMDLRKKIDGHWGKEDVPLENKKMVFIHVICEFSHWESKSINVIRTCIDHNLVVPDDVLIFAFQTFEKAFGTDNMLDYISKKQFVSSEKVRDAIFSVIDHYEQHIFYDIDSNKYVFLNCNNNTLRVI